MPISGGVTNPKRVESDTDPDGRYVLVICYDFPSIYGAGVIRNYQFAKNLAALGWQPVILTAQPCGGNREDDVELSDGELSCSKFTARSSLLHGYFQLGRLRKQKREAERVARNNGRLDPLRSFAAGLVVPDGKIGWWLPAVKRGLEIASRFPLQACFSTSPRPTAHFVARRLARRLKIPWVADFALPWSDAYWLNGRPSLIGRLDRRLESLIIRSAQHVTVAYADLGRSLAARHKNISKDKITVVPTGFEEGLFTDSSPALFPKFRIVYPGNHFCEVGRQGAYFLNAIDQWLDSEPHLEEKVEFVFVGKRDDELLRRRAVMRHPTVIRVEPLISHRACIQMILSSHLCVVNTVGNRIPAKVYECMRAGKWILALTDQGSDLAILVRHHSKGIVAPAKNVFAIQQAFQNAWRRRRPTGIEPETQAGLLHYSARESARSLAGIFDRLLQTRRII